MGNICNASKCHFNWLPYFKISSEASKSNETWKYDFESVTHTHTQESVTLAFKKQKPKDNLQ